MRNLFLTIILSAFTVFVLSAQNVSDLESFEKAMKPGTVLTYDVDAGGKKYQFIATVTKLGDEIAFDWKMTEPVSKTGNVLMSANAVSKAGALFNYFTGGESKLDNETSVFISRKVFNDVSSTSSADVRINGASDTVTVMSNTISEFSFNLNGNLVSVPGWELQGGGEVKYTVNVIESFKFPLIFSMNLGWTIQLTEVKNP